MPRHLPVIPDPRGFQTPRREPYSLAFSGKQASEDGVPPLNHNSVENVFVAPDAEVNEEDLNRKCTRFAVSGNKKRRLIDGECKKSKEESDSISAIGIELAEPDHTLRLPYLKSIWTELWTMTKMVSFVTVLPSGVECGGFFVRVVEGRKFDELTFRWPGPLVKPEYLHKK